MIIKISQRKGVFTLLILSILASLTLGLAPSGQIRLFPSSENSPSIYLLPFTVQTALPSGSYLLVTMDWYTSPLLSYNCILVNSSIGIDCTNLAAPTFPLTFTLTNIAKLNPKLPTTKTIAILLKSNLLAHTQYFLQLHLYNVIPNIQKISPSIEMYSISSKGLIYEANSNFGAVVNSLPINNLMAVSILNPLSSNTPGSTSSLRAEITISQAVSTALSTFIFVVQYPFSFSVGSIPSTIQSSLYSTSPIPLYSAPSMYSYEVISPNIFKLIFNEKFTVGRKFIIQINEINSPFIIASTNISIYSLNFNTLSPLEAFEMLYPIATVPYPLTVTMGLPFSAPFQGPMQLYQNINQFIQLQINIPYSVPNGYSIRIKINDADLLAGTAYSSFTSLTYDPIYTYFVATSPASFTISGMGPILIGTIVTITFQIKITSSSLFRCTAYIDTQSVIQAFASSSYLFEGLIEGSGVTSSSFYSSFNDNTIIFAGWNERVKSTAAIDSTQNFTLVIQQNINSIATSSSSYIDLYFSPNVIISNTFDANQDCQLRQTSTQSYYYANSCTVTYVQAPGYLKITIKPNSNYTTSVPNLFPFASATYISLKNLMFSLSTSNKNLYPLYMTLYKSDVVNPTTYLSLTYIQALPEFNKLTGVTFNYVNNFYSNLGSSNFQTYPGFLRFQSATPSDLNLVIQPNTQLTLVFFASFGIQSISGITNMGPYPCTSNIPIKCTFYKGVGLPWAQNQIFLYDRIMVTFLDLTYSTVPFHIIVPDTQINSNSNYFYYQLGFYNQLMKDWKFDYSGSYYRVSTSWTSTKVVPNYTLAADITGKAGAYRQNVSISVYYPQTPSASKAFLILSTQWSFFQNGISSLSPATLGMSTPATFGSNIFSPLGLYVDSNMYLTIIPFIYVATNSPFTIYLNNVHMPYTYDLPNYYIYVTKAADQTMSASNEFIMTNGGTLYSAPLQSLMISCQDNALGVVNTYCTVTFGTSNPLLGIGNVRIVFNGMSVATSTCSLTASGGTSIPVRCSSSTDKKNLTATLLGSGFYTAGNFTLVTYGVGITAGTLSQSITLYLYDSTIQYVIESGVRILMTTVASLSYISLSQIRYSYLSPLSYNTMFIQFYLPRMLYKDEQFAFVIGQDLSDVNTEVSRLRIVIQNENGTLLYPLFTIDNINYLIIFDFTDPAVLIPGSYVMTIYGICTPASQSNGAFNMIYRRTYDFTYTIVNSVNVIFPALNPLITSDISMNALFNTEGFKQQIEFTITNSLENVDSQMIWVFNFPSYYSPQLFQEDAYCMIDTAVIPCHVDPNTPFQLIATSSPKTISAGTSYKITLVGLAAPRALYTSNSYMSRYIFVGVLASSDSTQFSERTLLLPYQTIQSTVNGVIRVRDMLGISPTGLFSFSSIYAKFELDCNVPITTGSKMFFDLPLQFNNFNNIGFNAMIIYSTSTISVNTAIANRRIQVPISIDIPASAIFQLHFPNFPTPKTPSIARMSEIIVTITPSDKLSITSASTFQGNSAPSLTFLQNTRYISFNHDQTVSITAGTYSQAIDITSSDSNDFLTNINIGLQSTGFTFSPADIFLPIGETKRTFSIGADSSLVPIVYFYQATKTEEVNSQYQKTLNMNIQVTNNPVLITLPTSLDMPKGGCTPPFIIKLTNTPFQDISISYTYDNSAYGELVFFPNPWTTPRELKFTSIIDNNTLSFCSSNSLVATQIPITFHVTGTNYKSYAFTPSAVVNINVIAVVASPPTLSLVLKNQQKTFLDVNFTSNVDGTIFYQVILGSSSTPLDLQTIQVNIKNNKWLIQAPSFFMNRIYTKDIDNRLGQFYQAASTSTLRIDNLIPQTGYTICGYLVNNFGTSSSANCLRVSTMTWGSVIKAKLTFSQTLTDQQLNNILCFFTAVVGTSQSYLVDMEGNSCGNRKVENIYYKYVGTTQNTEKRGTNIYLITNPTITGTDPSPLAFTNLFTAQGQLSISTLSAAQSQFSITYLSATFINSYSARQLTALSEPAKLIPYFTTPVYSSAASTVTISNVRMVGSEGTIYFVLVLYKRISTPTPTMTQVNIQMNYVPTAEQVLNCKNWQQITQTACARAVYTGVSPLTITFSSILPNSVYVLYYMTASEFPLRPIVTGQVYSQSIVTYSWEGFNKLSVMVLLLVLLVSI